MLGFQIFRSGIFPQIIIFGLQVLKPRTWFSDLNGWQLAVTDIRIYLGCEIPQPAESCSSTRPGERRREVRHTIKRFCRWFYLEQRRFHAITLSRSDKSEENGEEKGRRESCRHQDFVVFRMFLGRKDASPLSPVAYAERWRGPHFKSPILWAMKEVRESGKRRRLHIESTTYPERRRQELLEAKYMLELLLSHKSFL